MIYEIICGDCLAEMKKMPDNSIDFIVCDPPYMLNFMGKDFDKFENNPAANPIYWQEALRICKPGSMLAAFGGDRTHHHLMIALEQAGWEIRSCCYWLTGQGFPKSCNFGRKLGPEWHGYGTALKPAAEIIVLAMKKLDKNFAQNAEKWGVAGYNIDACRIKTYENLGRDNKKINKISPFGVEDGSTFGNGKSKQYGLPVKNQGRWPSNFLIDEETAEMIDQQSGILKSGTPGKRRKEHKSNSLNHLNTLNRKETGVGDSGGASRFFFCAKVSPAERNRGLEGLPLKEVQTDCGGDMPIDDKGNERDRFKKKCYNHHPTVKPIALMKYIIKLLAPPGNPILLDPFMGSGSTLLAAQELGIRSIGIELSPEYCEIARARLKAAEPQQLELFTQKC